VKQTGIAYNVQLQKIVRAVKRDIDAQIVPLLKTLAPQYVQDGWADTINVVIQQLLTKWTSPLARHAATQIAASFVKTAFKASEGRQKRSLGIDQFTTSVEMKNTLEAATLQNARLITSIPAQYLEQVSNIVMGNMRTGMRPSAIEAELTAQFGVTKRRAKFIARDQTAKVQGELTKQRQIDAGYQYFKWVDSEDQRVRHRHHEIATSTTSYGVGVYRWTKLPLSDDGQPIQPGSDYNCRCVSIAVSDEEVMDFQARARS
jgi:SPP1 gp7 family putative phage head morphogenesis protein